ncbi:Uncharacterised protein [Vibrio cholerae]|uniref:Uncharacterized protein n=2 Tax=Vibrio cholerae TaxID=666 RepID=A0A655ZYE3_VIBCL|nr:Uncharacterised protein [Vibrio cholerae]
MVFSKICENEVWSESNVSQVCLVSHQAQPTGQPCKRTKTAGTPVNTPSPWIISNISFIRYKMNDLTWINSCRWQTIMEIAIEVKLNASIPFLVQASAILATVVHPNYIEHLGSSYTACLQLQVIGG